MGVLSAPSGMELRAMVIVDGWRGCCGCVDGYDESGTGRMGVNCRSGLKLATQLIKLLNSPSSSCLS